MKQLEAEFQAQVMQLAKLRGWRSAHFRRSRTKTGWSTAVAGDGVGWPDLFLVRATTGQKLAAELKVPPNKVTPEQTQWLSDMEACGIPAFVWCPKDWDEIETVLEHGPK